MKALALLLALTTLASAEWTNLWPAEAPGAKQPPSGTEKDNGGRLTDIEIPQYQVYLPEKNKATGAAVVILPGGGYGMLASNHEGHDIAKWLTGQGIAGIVVKYRVSGNAALGYQFPVPFLDARRAIRTVREKSGEWGVDTKKIGIMGFSAGGHLASLCTTRFADTFPEEGKDAVDKQDCRPDFSILIYPVISMDPALAHGGSRKNLLGNNPDPEISAKYSTEKAVTKDTPPVFLLTTADDGVDCRNSLEFAIACKANNVPVSLHLFEKGGHGYGLNGKGDLAAWPQLLEKWLASHLPAGK
ncbi:alpha/beta hydrolase [Luteolibacter yonseiensis]|uniref:Alpha/beta hydrolase n=1 Tax=Luteolibacter yonseiensis TaxID=1144680 RepID=A0A934VA63_9BACT|nr:alpha/beta hydrolase [Luteolibacter yonseiensis]MBK1815888.1 alpha/beta hydrolase [Luteolibacter yonseiensis]